MMPHEDPSRRYWQADEEEFRRAQRRSLAASADEAKAGGPADRLFYEVFVRPDLGPRAFQEPRAREIVAFSFLDHRGDEVRVGLDSTNGEWFDGFIQVLTVGHDEIWYPSARCSYPLSWHDHIRAGLDEVALRRGSSEHRCLVRDAVVCMESEMYCGQYVFLLRPERGELLLELAYWWKTAKCGSHFPKGLDLPLRNLPQLLDGMEACKQAIETLYAEAEAEGRLISPARGDTLGVDVTLRVRKGDAWVPRSSGRPPR